MAKKQVVKVKAAPASAEVSAAWSKAVEDEEREHRNAQSGNQLSRLAAYRAIVALDKAGAACDAATAAPVAAE